MQLNTEVVGTIEIDHYLLDVYSSLDEPLFKASDIAHMIDYSRNNIWNMLQMCEEDEKLLLPMVVSSHRRPVNFVTEMGLYNILSQSRVPIARKWRRVIHNELIQMRKERSMNISEQFDFWNHEIDGIYFDESTGMLMQSITIQGGDVIQRPYEEGVKHNE